MAILKNQVYTTKEGKLLKVVKVTESGFHHLREVDINGDDVKDKRNSLAMLFIERIWSIQKKQFNLSSYGNRIKKRSLANY